MSELNKKKDNTFKFVIIYFVIAVFLTISAIIFYKVNGIGIIEYFSTGNTLENIIDNEATDSENTEEIVKENNIKRVSPTDTYKSNNIEIVDENYEYGEEIYQYDSNPIRKIRISYFQISGLKDKSIEDKINKKIEEKCKDFVSSEEVNDEEIQNILVTANYNSNFSNLLSIAIYKSVSYKDSRYAGYEETMNLRLDTAEEIKFEEMFTPDASIKNIITQAAYNSMSKKINQEYYFGDEDFEGNAIDYSQIENLTYKILKEFETIEYKKFYFSPFSISLITSCGDIEIPMLDFYEYINIFNLVNPEESLYEAGDADVSTYVFGQDYSKGMEFDGKISNYIYLTIYNYYKLTYESYSDDYESEMLESLDIYKENLDTIKNSIINYEKSLNTNKGAFYNINSYYINEENEIIFDCARVEVEKPNFDKNVEEIYMRATRAEAAGELIFRLSEEENIEYYNLTLKDGEVIINEITTTDEIIEEL